jgi:hypothetical protein
LPKNNRFLDFLYSYKKRKATSEEAAFSFTQNTKPSFLNIFNWILLQIYYRYYTLYICTIDAKKRFVKKKVTFYENL